MRLRDVKIGCLVLLKDQNNKALYFITGYSEQFVTIRDIESKETRIVNYKEIVKDTEGFFDNYEVINYLKSLLLSFKERAMDPKYSCETLTLEHILEAIRQVEKIDV